MLEAAGRYTLRIVGPNCIGVMVPSVGFNARFAHIAPKPGHLAFVAQSGAIATSVSDWATSRGIGFSHVVSLGDVCGILLYIEAITHARKFMAAARAVARIKPVVVIKVGRHPAAARAVASH